MRRTDATVEAAVVQAYTANESVPKLCERLGVKKATAYLILKRAGVIARGVSECRRTYTARHDFFDRIDTPERAYLLGFWAADGWVSGGEAGVQLHQKDAGHLKLIRGLLESDHPLTVNRRCVRLAIKSPQLVEGLRRAWVTERKTFTVAPWPGPADLMPHYWRGVMDGDGYWGTGSGGLGGFQFNLELTGNRAMCDGFLGFIRAAVGGPVGSVTPAKSVFRVRLSGVGAVQPVVRALYPPGEYPALDRKRAIAERCLATEVKRPKTFRSRGRNGEEPI